MRGEPLIRGCPRNCERRARAHHATGRAREGAARGGDPQARRPALTITHPTRGARGRSGRSAAVTRSPSEARGVRATPEPRTILSPRPPRVGGPKTSERSCHASRDDPEIRVGVPCRGRAVLLSRIRAADPAGGHRDLRQPRPERGRADRLAGVGDHRVHASGGRKAVRASVSGGRARRDRAAIRTGRNGVRFRDPGRAAAIRARRGGRDRDLGPDEPDGRAVAERASGRRHEPDRSAEGQPVRDLRRSGGRRRDRHHQPARDRGRVRGAVSAGGRQLRDGAGAAESRGARRAGGRRLHSGALRDGRVLRRRGGRRQHRERRVQDHAPFGLRHALRDRHRVDLRLRVPAGRGRRFRRRTRAGRRRARHVPADDMGRADRARFRDVRSGRERDRRLVFRHRQRKGHSRVRAVRFRRRG